MTFGLIEPLACQLLLMIFVAIRLANFVGAVVFFMALFKSVSNASEPAYPKFVHSIGLPLPSPSYYPCQSVVQALVKGYRAVTFKQRDQKRNEILLALSKFDPSESLSERAQSDRSELWRQLIRLHAIDSKPLEIFLAHNATWKPVQIILSTEDLRRLSNAEGFNGGFVMNLGEADVPLTSPHFYRDHRTYFDSIYPSSLSVEQKNQILERAELDARMKALFNDLGTPSKDGTIYGRFETHYLHVMDSRIYRFKDLNADQGPTDIIHNPGDLRRIRDLSRKLGSRDWDHVVDTILDFAKSNFKDQAGVEREAIQILNKISVLDERLSPERTFSKEAVDEALHPNEFGPASDPGKTGAYPIIASSFSTPQEAHDALSAHLIPPPKGLKKKIDFVEAMLEFNIEAFIYLKRNSPELYEKAKRQFIKNVRSAAGSVFRYTKENTQAQNSAYKLFVRMDDLAHDLNDPDWTLNPREFRSPNEGSSAEETP